MTKFKVSVTRGFSAAHALRAYKGKCENLHGHNWKIKVTLSANKLDKTGMAMDFKDIKCVLDSILGEMDHSYLNQNAPFDKINPTAENIAEHILKRMARMVPGAVRVTEVEVWESDTSSATAING